MAIFPLAYRAPLGHTALARLYEGLLGSVRPGTNSVLTNCLTQYIFTNSFLMHTLLSLESYFCIAGAMSPLQPTLNHTGGPCPPGNYCPLGTGSPIPCPIGTFTNFTRNTGVNTMIVDGKVTPAQCLPCPPGLACDSAGSNLYPVKSCAAGYFCISVLAQY